MQPGVVSKMINALMGIDENHPKAERMPAIETMGQIL